MADDTPSYYRLRLGMVQGINKMLPPLQAARVLYAIEMLYFYGKEPEEIGLTLPPKARGFYEAERDTVLAYRRSVTNGSKSTGRPKVASKTEQQTARQTAQQTSEVLDEFSVEF